jgi:Protein of unknown function (DUF2865)
MRVRALRLPLFLYGIAVVFTPSAAKADYCASLRADVAARSPAQLQRQLDQAQAQVSQAGCFGGFFFFQPSPGRHCSAALARVNRLQAMLASSGSGGMSSGFTYDVQKRQSELRQALAQSGCASTGFSGNYRTLCVRTCDGYYFPISYATNQSRFKTDAAVCQSMYPPGEVALYVHLTSGEDATKAVSLTGEPLANASFAFAYRSTYDHVCAALFRSGSGAQIAVTKPPVPDSVVAASMVTPVALPRRGKQPKVPDAAAAGEMPANLDPGVQSAEASGDLHVNADGVRTVGPAYYYEPSYVASTDGEPPKLAKPDLPDPPAVSTEEPPVEASILPNPLDLFRKHKSAPPPEPEPDPAN